MDKKQILNKALAASRYAELLGKCYKETNQRYRQNGGRGVTVCDEWLNDFNAFHKWWEENYVSGHAITLKGDSKEYGPDTAQFLSRRKTASKFKSGKLYEAFGEQKTMTQWQSDERSIVSPGTLERRVRHFGWEMERALTTPKANKNTRPRESVVEW